MAVLTIPLTPGSISFTVIFVPCQILCLVSLLAAQALVDDAFEAHFPSVEDFLNRPKLKDNQDYMQLNWKDEMLDQQILQVSYDQYRNIWNSTVQAAGCREPIRPYATRVGAGARLDGELARTHSISLTPDKRC